jgi:glycosyltransferase involved in cell wall biosynthesis
VKATVSADSSAALSPRILLAAYQCGPGMGSVSQIGWEWYTRLATRTSVTLVTHVRNRSVIEQSGGARDGSEICYIDTEWFAGPLYRLAARLFPRSPHATFLFSSFDFFVYDRTAECILRERWNRGERWDIIHVVTPVSPVAATRFYRLGAPLVVGPWNGGLGILPAFKEIMRQDASWVYPLRQLGRLADLWFGTTCHAAMIFTATQATLAALPRSCHSRCTPMLENGVDLDIFTPSPWSETPSVNQPLRLIFVGRLAPFKGIPLLLKALAQVQREFPVRLTIVGDGPLMRDWRRLAGDLGVAEHVDFRGACSASEVAAQLRQHQVMCLPSVRESGGAVLLEAMACARPVIAVAFGGPAEIVDDAVGCAVPATSPEAVVAGFAQALRDVVQNPDAWRRRGEEGRRRAEQQYSWKMKIEQALGWYHNVLARNPAAALPALASSRPQWNCS